MTFDILYEKVIALDLAYYELLDGGIWHEQQFTAKELEMIDIINKININKPEYVHYNNIMSWWRANKVILKQIDKFY